MAYVDQKLNSARAASLGAAVLVELAIGYGLAVGLANHFLRQPVTEIQTYNVPKEKDPPRLPPVQRHDQHQQITKTETIVQVPDGADTGLKIAPPPLGLDTRIALNLPTLPNHARGLQVRGDRGQWFSTIDYPASAARDGEEGTVGISVRIDTNGRVSGCAVTQSSGHAALDEITCKLYAKRGRFVPALGADGNPVEASYADRVRWQLPTD